MNAKDSEVFKVVCHALLARLDPAQSPLKVLKNLGFFSAKMACFRVSVIFGENCKFFGTWDDFAQGLNVVKSMTDHFKNFRIFGVHPKSFNALQAVLFEWWTIENGLTTYVCNGPPMTYDAHCMSKMPFPPRPQCMSDNSPIIYAQIMLSILLWLYNM